MPTPKTERTRRHLRISLQIIFLLVVFSLVAGNYSIPQDDSSGKSFRVRGRLSVYNGTPSCRIWVVGTSRILGIHETNAGEECPIPSRLLEILRENIDDRLIFADFTVTPLAPRREGIMQPVKFESAENIVVTNRNMQILRQMSGIVK
jgi:hypothetical protein